MNETPNTAATVPLRPHFHIGQVVTYRGRVYIVDDLQPVLPGPVWCAWLASPEEYFAVPCIAIRRATPAQARELTVTT